jgi:hypothetical protein
VLLYDLTSTYFEADPPFPEGDKRRFGYSRDHRPDCVQIIIALVVTPEGLPLAYEVLPGNIADKTTLRGFLERIERQYSKAPHLADAKPRRKYLRSALTGILPIRSPSAGGRASRREASSRMIRAKNASV